MAYQVAHSSCFAADVNLQRLRVLLEIGEPSLGKVIRVCDQVTETYGWF